MLIEEMPGRGVTRRSCVRHDDAMRTARDGHRRDRGRLAADDREQHELPVGGELRPLVHLPFLCGREVIHPAVG